MIYGIAYYRHSNDVVTGQTIVGRTPADLQREAERLKAIAYRDQYQELLVKLQGEWVGL